MDNVQLWGSAVQLQQYLESKGHPFCFIGGIALQRWGQPRVTEDLDVTLITRFGQEGPVIRELTERFQGRIRDVAEFAIRSRMLLLQDAHGVNIDVSLGGLSYEHRVQERSSMWGTPAVDEIRTCSAEDLIILKTFAGRPQDWIDVESVAERMIDELDLKLVFEELEPLLAVKEDSSSASKLETIFNKQ